MSTVQGLRAPGGRTGGRTEEGPITFRDVGATGPGTLAGRYLRRFWQPVFHSADLKVGEAKPIRIMGEDFTIYRGASGAPFVIDARCPHRAMPMHLGWVEGDEVRCFYHGWKFSGDGRCTEQPAERPDFCHKVRTGAYPTQDYLGLVFAYLGEGEAPALPRYPAFEAEDVLLNQDSYVRACHFFNNLENGGDIAHIAFAHHDNAVAWDEKTEGPTLAPCESSWGVTIKAVFPGGNEVVSQFGMPNILHARGVPDDPEVEYREFIAWWVPHDDDRHTQFTRGQAAAAQRGDAAVSAAPGREDGAAGSGPGGHRARAAGRVDDLGGRGQGAAWASCSCRTTWRRWAWGRSRRGSRSIWGGATRR